VLPALLLLAGCASTGAKTPAAPTSKTSTTLASGATTAAGTITFSNPVLGQGADPFVTVVKGRYYYVQSSSGNHGVSMRSSTSLATLQFAPETTVFEGGGKAPCCEYWAPEVHRIGGSWYVYVAADDGDNAHHRTYVFKASRITGPYAFAGELKLPGNRWAIDATILRGSHGTDYVLWSGWPGASNGEQDIYIAKLSNPTTVTGARVRLSRPQYAWEQHAGTVGVEVNEGPAVLARGGKVYVTYSGSGCWTPDYALGMLSADASSNLLDPSSWHKSPTPIFHGGSGSGEYGTGHNSFFSSPDGRQTWLVYHAVTSPGGSCGADRQVYAQPVRFAADGTPQLGSPSGDQARLPFPAGDPGH
jgi:GH43 family beta-xylosidase